MDAGLSKDIGVEKKSITILCDSQSVFHERSKHIDIKLHFSRNVIESGLVSVKKISTEENAGDMCTKVLPGIKFKYCM